MGAASVTDPICKQRLSLNAPLKPSYWIHWRCCAILCGMSHPISRASCLSCVRSHAQRLSQLGYEVSAGRAGRANNPNFDHGGHVRSGNKRF